MASTHTESAVSSSIPAASPASTSVTTTVFAPKPRELTTLLAGATAGLCVDLAVYPLDTIKTRLQNFSHSIRPSGRLFAGLPVVFCGSAPSAALFFYTYETVKATSRENGHPVWLTLLLSAGISEMVACIVRVPYETIKQRAQSQPHFGVRTVLSETLRIDGWTVLYRGYLSTILRGLPFSLIQYPVWEMLKRSLKEHNRRVSSSDSSAELSKSQFALCGALAGATAGACTTPFDVAKTRIMLAQKGSPLVSGNVITAFKQIYLERGLRGLFAGVAPRVGQVSIGGAIFLGLYDITKRMWSSVLH